MAVVSMSSRSSARLEVLPQVPPLRSHPPSSVNLFSQLACYHVAVNAAFGATK